MSDLRNSQPRRTGAALASANFRDTLGCDRLCVGGGQLGGTVRFAETKNPANPQSCLGLSRGSNSQASAPGVSALTAQSSLLADVKQSARGMLPAEVYGELFKLG